MRLPLLPFCSSLWMAGAAALLGGVALGAMPAAGQSIPREQTMIVSGAGAVASVDPVRAVYFQTNRVTSRTYSALVTYDKDLNVIGDLASDFKVADDVRSIQFTLRDAVFHDGTPVTPADVAYSLDRYVRIGSGIAVYLTAYDRTEVTGDKTLVIHLKKPSSLFLTALSKVFILNSKLVAANAGSDDAQGWLQNNDAGSGPYQMTGVNQKDITLVWFDKHWEKRGRMAQSIIFRRSDESATMREELRTGAIDASLSIIENDLDMLEKEKGVVSVAYGRRPSVNGVVFNTRVGPTADAKVREAITLAYDYAGAFKGIHKEKGYMPAGPLPDTLSCRPDFAAPVQNLEKARALLAEAGQKDLTLTMRFQPAFKEQVAQATLLQSNLAEIGVTLNLEPIAFPNYLAMLADPNQIPQMMLLGDSALFPDVGVYLQSTYASTAIGTNKSGYANPELDALLDKAAASGDQTERCDLYKKAQQIIDADHVFMPMFWAGINVVFRSDRMADPLANAVGYNYAPILFEGLKD